MKNHCAKKRSADNPYEVWVSHCGSWTWKVLKKYQGPAAEAKNQFARWHCAVSSPYTHGGYDMGDVYAAEVKAQANKETDK